MINKINISYHANGCTKIKINFSNEKIRKGFLKYTIGLWAKNLLAHSNLLPQENSHARGLVLGFLFGP